MALALHDLVWQSAAACIGYPGEWWFPDRRPGAGDMAKQICHRCPVRLPCLTFALSGNEDFGIWGGFTTRDIDIAKRARCRYCDGRISPAEAAALAIADGAIVDRYIWACRACWYRKIAERRRT